MKIDEFILLVKWFEYSQYFKNILSSKPLNNSISNEYYLINSDWIKNFKEAFNYYDLKHNLYKNNLQGQVNMTPLDDNAILQIYNANCFPPIKNEYKNKIRNIDNSKIAQMNLKISNKFINNYYKDFIIVNNTIYEILKKNFYMNETPKVNIYIGNNTFIMILSGNVIEVGIINSTYDYEIYLFQYTNSAELNEELEKLKNIGIKNYFKEYKININKKEQIIYKSNGYQIYFINLNLILNQNNNNISNQQVTIINNNENEKDIDISNKRGLKNFDGRSSRLNSLIQLITSIKEIRDELIIKNQNFYSKYNHIYILTSTLINIFNELYNPYDMNKGYELKELKIINDFIEEGINDRSLDKFLLYFLDTLHEELNCSEFKKNNKISLVSFNSPYDSEINSWSNFVGYYQNYYQSIISDCFNWIRKENNKCTECHNSVFSFQAFPFIVFDLEKTYEFIISNQTEYKNLFNQYKGDKKELEKKIAEYKKKKEKHPIHIQNCFDYYSKNTDNNETNCIFCNKKTKHISNYLVYKSPKYFIIIINRKDLKNIAFEEDLNLETFVDEASQYKLYKLLGAIVFNKFGEREKHYFSVLKDKEMWKKFDDDKISNINLKDEDYCKKARMFIYRGIDN